MGSSGIAATLLLHFRKKFFDEKLVNLRDRTTKQKIYHFFGKKKFKIDNSSNID